MYLRNAWYVAASDSDIGHSLYPTTLLGEPVVLFRKTDGELVALEDACPHRKLPLSLGRLDGNQIECGYHGLTFDGQGTCTRAPTSGRIPSRARVHSYPVHVRYGLVWLWMGEPSLADVSKRVRGAGVGRSAVGTQPGCEHDGAVQLPVHDR